MHLTAEGACGFCGFDWKGFRLPASGFCENLLWTPDGDRRCGATLYARKVSVALAPDGRLLSVVVA